jgi:hypothetical protein
MTTAAFAKTATDETAPPPHTSSGDQQEYDGSSICNDSGRQDNPPRTLGCGDQQEHAEAASARTATNETTLQAL